MKAETEKTLLHCLLLTLAIFIPYHQVAQHRFVEFDDAIYAFGNVYIVRGWSWDSIVWAFSNTDTANWHPLTWLTHLIDREIFGAHAGGYFLMNVAWHTASTCLCYAAFHRVTRNRFFAFTVALIFAVHPANVENVAWASERKSLVDALFWFLGIIAYFDYLETRQFKQYGLLIITHCLGLMGKAMHVTFPCAIVLLHLLHLTWQHGGRALPWRDYRAALLESLKIVWPMLLLTVYFSALTAVSQRVAMSNLETLSVSGRFINVLLSYQRYLEMFFSPQELAPFYPLFFLSLKPAQAILPLIILGLTTLGLLWLARVRPSALLGWFWFLGTMVPVVGLVQVGSQSHADRYLYIPMIGLAFVIPELFALVQSWSQRTRAFAQTAWLALAALFFGSATYIQVGYWRNGVELFTHSLSVTGDCLTSVNCLAASYLRQERYHEAITFLDSKIAVAKNPDNISKFHTMKAQAYLMLKQYDDVIATVKKSVDLGRKEAINHWLLTCVYYTQSKYDLARVELVEAKKLFKSDDKTSLINADVQEGFKYMEATLMNSTATPETAKSASTN